MEHDIVERLRSARCCILPNEYEDHELPDQVADEIERLRAKIATLESEIEWAEYEASNRS